MEESRFYFKGSMEEQRSIKLTNSILKIILDTNCRVHGGSKKTNKEAWMVSWRMMGSSDEGGKCKDGEDTSRVPHGTQTKIQILKVDFQGSVRKDSPLQLCPPGLPIAAIFSSQMPSA